MLGTLIYWIKNVRFLPALAVFLTSKKHELVHYECERWLLCNNFKESGRKGFVVLMSRFPEYRSLFYYRTGCNWLRHFAKGQTNLYFHTPSDRIGKGLVIWHGYSTVINAQSIGENCSVWHNVTLGKKTTQPVDDRPIIGDNVSVCTGAIVVGDIKIADGVTIGAGSVVVDSIHNKNAVVVGPKAKEIVK